MLILRKRFLNLIIALAISSLLLTSCGETESSSKNNGSSSEEITNVSSKDESTDKNTSKDESTDKNTSKDESTDKQTITKAIITALCLWKD